MLAPAGANAAVSFGSALDRAPSAAAASAGSCGASCTLQQQRFAGAGISSPVDGVITSWRVRASASVPGLRLRLIRGSRGAGTSAPVTAAAGTTRHTARLPVQAGDGIGVDFFGGGSIIANDLLLLGNANLRGWRPGLAEGADQAPNMTELSVSPWELLLNATVEPDADSDGFGDESQDGCPSDAARQGSCTGPVGGGGGTGGGTGRGGGGSTGGGSGGGGTGRGGSDALRVQISSKAVRLDRKGVAHIGLACPARVVAPCQGTLLLETARRISSQGKERARKLRLGGAPFSIPAGGRASAAIPVTGKNRKILRRVGATKVVARGNTLDAAGNTTAARVTITLRPR